MFANKIKPVVIAGAAVFAFIASGQALAETNFEVRELSPYTGNVENKIGRVISLGQTTVQRSIVKFEVRKSLSSMVEQHNVILTPPSPKYHHVVLIGGAGAAKCNEGSAVEKNGMKEGTNFLLRTRLDYAKAGGNTVVYCAPSDRWGKGETYRWLFARNGHHDEYRASDAFLEDFRALSAYLKAQHDVPIVVNGTSAGARAAAHLAVNVPELIDIVIMSVPPTGSSSATPKSLLTGMKVETIKQPTLVLVNADDECKQTPPAKAKELFDVLPDGTKSFVSLNGGTIGSGKLAKPCRPLSYHGFHGIEESAVAETIKFIDQNL